MSGVHELSFEASVGRSTLSTREIARVIRGLLEPLLASAELARLEVAMTELCNNAVEHGAEDHPCYQIALQLSSGELTLTLRDHGCAFDPNVFQRPNVDPDDRNSLPTGSMGLAVIHDAMDEVVWQEQDGVQSTTLTLRVDRDPIVEHPYPFDAR